MNEQEEMRKTLIEKFYELDEIHVDDIEVTPDNVISAANVMDSIYRTLFIDETQEGSEEHDIQESSQEDAERL